MNPAEPPFSLADTPGHNVCCTKDGLWVGEAPLLKRSERPADEGRWRPRGAAELNHDLSRCYALPVEIDRKLGGLAVVAAALDRGDLVHAQMAALHLRLPDPPSLQKSARDAIRVRALARQLEASGLLKADWNPADHPQWPAGSPGGIGGQFAPRDGAAVPGASRPAMTLSQLPLTVPGEMFEPRFPGIPIPQAPGQPLPTEIQPPPLIAPHVLPREELRNPYPDRPECVEEWAYALKMCEKLRREKKLGKGEHRGMGKTYNQCVRGQVSESCGGNRLGA